VDDKRGKWERRIDIAEELDAAEVRYPVHQVGMYDRPDGYRFRGIETGLGEP